MDWIRVLILVGSWAIIPLHLYTFWRVTHQLQVWRSAEDERVTRWRSDMIQATKLLEECQHLRHQAEISLAMARQARNEATEQ